MNWRLVPRDSLQHFMSPLKHIRFFKVREKKLMYFIFQNLGPVKYIRCEKMTLSTKVHFESPKLALFGELRLDGDPIFGNFI